MRMGREKRDRAPSEAGAPIAAERGLWNSRLAVMGACALVGVVTVLAYVREVWLSALAVIWGDGVIALLWVAAATMLGSLLVPRVHRRDKQSVEWPLYLVSSAAVGLGIFSLLTLGLGLAGMLSWGVAVGMPAGAALIWVGRVALRQGNISLRPQMDALEQWLRQPAGWGWWWLAAMPFLGIMLAGAALPPGILWKPGDPHPYDVLEYHLQVPREWYELGRIVPLKHNVYSFFPYNVEMQYLLGMYIRGGPWAGMYLAQLMSAAYMVLAVGGVYASVRAMAADEKLAVGRATLAGVAAATVPWLSMLGSVAYNEAGLLLYGTLALGWIAVALTSETPLIPKLIVAGVMAGLACGVKYTGVPIFLVGATAAVAAIVGIWAARRRPAWRGLAVGVGVYVLAGLAMLSPWLARNWAWTGNPVFPEAMPLLGRGHFSQQQMERWEQAHTQRPDQKPWGRRIAAGWEQVVSDWRYGLVLLPLGLVAAAGGLRRVSAAFLLTMLAGLAVFWLGFTHLQSRFFVLGVPMAAMLLGMIRNRWGVLAGLGIVVVAAAGSLGTLDQTLSPTMEIVRQSGAVGIEDLSVFLPEKVEHFIQGGARLALVGDAQAFAYTMPMEDLRYRTVFDLDVRAGQDLIDAWLGGNAEEIRRDHHLVIDRAELQRLWETYTNLPQPKALSEGSGPIVVPPMGQ